MIGTPYVRIIFSSAHHIQGSALLLIVNSIDTNFQVY